MEQIYDTESITVMNVMVGIGAELQRAFRMAGVERLLMNLWEVPDKETAEFMQFFYSFLFTVDDISEAFQKTQQEMRQLYPDEPFKWAAFVLLE